MTSSVQLLARRALAILLVVWVVGGSLELHNHSGLSGHGLWGEASGCHPELATHLEPPKPDEPRECLGCLSRLRPREGLVEAQALGPLPFAAFFVGLEQVELFASVALAPPASRGPPSVFA